jgi:hypothetical protein
MAGNARLVIGNEAQSGFLGTDDGRRNYVLDSEYVSLSMSALGFFFAPTTHGHSAGCIIIDWRPHKRFPEAKHAGFQPLAGRGLSSSFPAETQ